MHRHPRSPNEWAIMVIAVVFALVNVGLGATLIFGLPSRTSGPSFAQIRELIPIVWWGYGLVVAGTTAVVAQFLQRMWVVAAAHAFAGFMCVYWALAFYMGLDNVNVSATGCWAYLGIGLTHYILAVTAIADQLLAFVRNRRSHV